MGNVSGGGGANALAILEKLKELETEIELLKEARKTKRYNGIGCIVDIFGDTAMLRISTGDITSVKGGNTNDNIIATLPEGLQIDPNMALWQPITLVSDNWAPINDVASLVDLTNGLVRIRCSSNHNVSRIYGSVIFRSDAVTFS